MNIIFKEKRIMTSLLGLKSVKHPEEARMKSDLVNSFFNFNWEKSRKTD